MKLHLLYGDNMKYKMRIQNIFKYILVVMVITGMGIGDTFFIVSALNSDIANSPSIFIDSRFKLWDSNEKMLDKNFNITIIYVNESGFYYNIIINENNYSGMANLSYTNSFWLNETDIITLLEIQINNNTIFKENNIIITSGITQSVIDTGLSPFTINLKPSEWTQKEWNIFWSIFLGSILSFYIAFRIIKKYRKLHGVKVIE